ncbi:MAG: ABC transporter permease [Planctomycetaceae bacterium]|nr:ABC transporter permease [Planctomycetaceae bacterium]|tara:strand:- start:1975 stop:2841 length:867 start_codon:yes stop_codon:yes gene_type:complete
MASVSELQKISENVEQDNHPSLYVAIYQRINLATFFVGDLTLFVFRIISWAARKKLRPDTFVKAAYQIGVLSLPVVGLTGMFIGMVLAVQSFFQFSQIGMESRMGAVINLTLVRELGPVLAATMLAGRVGSAMAAELGTMRVTEQIDALKSMGVNPIHFLVVPRVFAALLLIPILTLMADFMGILGGFAYSHYILHIDAHQYFEFSRQYVTGFDLLTGIIKSLFFGGCIAIVSCYFGFHSKHGAQGVGNAATAAFVTSFVLILAMDLMVGISLDKLYYYFHPAGASLF